MRRLPWLALFVVLTGAGAISAPLVLALSVSVFGAADGGAAAPTFGAYRALLEGGRFLPAVTSSVVVAAGATMLALSLAAPAGYAIARLRLPWSRGVLASLLVLAVLPQVVLVSPLYLLLRALGLLDSWIGLIIADQSIVLPIAVWSLAGAFRAIPQELEEAARVDGASRLRVFFAIVLPLSWPGVAASAAIVFIACWNELLFALSFTISPERHTLPVAISLLFGRYEVPWAQVMAAAVLGVLPVALLVLSLQRRIEAGLIAGGTKG